MAQNETYIVKILVCGSTGALRSFICNGILGEPLLDETKEEILTVTTWEDDRNGMAFEVTSVATFDDVLHTPAEYEEKIRTISNQQYDVFLYCIPVKVSRPSLEDDKRGYEELKRLLHGDIWSRCVVVLTYADAIVIRGQTKHKSLGISRQVKDDYNSTIQGWMSAINDLFENGPSIVAAGSPQCVSLLHDNDLWLSKLFLVIQDKTENIPSKLLLLKNINRIKETVSNKESILRNGVHQQPIIITEKSRKVKQRLQEMVPGLGAAATAGLVGATVGGLTGALAIGLPSFGVFAGTGLALGALLGGTIGAGAVVTVQRAASRERMKSPTEGLM